MLAFVSIVDEKKRIRALEESHCRRLLLGLVDRWVHATVLAISLREVFDRILVIGDKLKKWRGLDRWKNANRIYEFRQRRIARIDSVSAARRTVLREAVVLAWSAAAHKVRLNREASEKLKKRRAISQLTAFARAKRKNRAMTAHAEEFAVRWTSERLVGLIDRIVAEWRCVTANEQRLADTHEAVRAARMHNTKLEFLERWREAIEIKLYDEDLEANGNALAARVDERVLSDVFTFMVIMFREAQGLLRFAREYSENRLRAKVLMSLVVELQRQRKRKQLETAVAMSLKNRSFHELFKEAFFAIKERLVLKEKWARLVFTQLRAYSDARRHQLQAMVIARWKKHSQVKRDAGDLKRKAQVFSTWQVLVKETRLAKLYMPAFESDSIPSARSQSYHQQRRKKYDVDTPPETPIATPVTQAVSVNSTPIMFSYRDMRPKSASRTRDEQRI
jgi:hypothetical protein